METVSPSDVWSQTLDVFREKVEDNEFATWLSPTRFHSLENDILRVSVPSPYYENWLSSNYGEELLAILRARPASQNIQLEFVAEVADKADEYLDPDAAEALTHEGPARVQIEAEMANIRFTKLNDEYTFDTFVVGENNRFAHAAGRAVADPASKAYNPLFIYGGVGLGKTHLMHAIGHEFRGNHPILKTLYVTTEQFVASFIDAIKSNRSFEFRNLLRNVDLLMIDDIQFLAGKEQTQIEFFHTFNDLYNAGKKIVISSDRSPQELAALEERLRSRFEWGLSVDIQAPNLETRIAILQRKAQREDVVLPEDVALCIAERITANIRQLEGALHRLKSYALLHERPIDMELTKEVMGHLLADGPEQVLNGDVILQVVCDYFQVRPQDIIGSARQKKFTVPRHVAMYMIRQLIDMPYKDIGAQFGGRDHSSVMHASAKVKKDLQTDPNMQNSINFLMRKIRETS
ncbi:chromosomal replication initiator protein DnaA [Candidatus Sumerlaeota bacterium]